MDNTEDSHPAPAAGDLERDVRAAMYRPVQRGTARSELALTRETLDAIVPVVVRLIEEQRAPLIEKLDREVENHSACDGQTRSIIADLRARAEKAEAERDALAAAVTRVRALCDGIGLGTVWTDKVLAALDGTETTR